MIAPFAHAIFAVDNVDKVVDVSVHIVNLGFAGIVAWLLIKVMVKTIMTRLERIERDCTQIVRFVTPGFPINLDSQQARQFIKLGLDYDAFQMKHFLASELVWEATRSEQYLREKAVRRLYRALQEMRRFFNQFHVEKGALDTPLWQQLPISDGFGGTLVGDRLFSSLINQVLEIVRDTNLRPDEKIRTINDMIDGSRDRTETMMNAWLVSSAGLPPAAAAQAQTPPPARSPGASVVADDVEPDADEVGR